MNWTEADYIDYMGRYFTDQQGAITTYGAPSLSDQPETAFQSRIIRLARQHGWLCHHSHDSRRNEWGCDAGLPDLILVRESIIFAELKTRTSKVTAEQARWLTMLSHTDNRAEVYLWRPADWPTIEARLTQPWRDAP